VVHNIYILKILEKEKFVIIKMEIPML